MGGLFIVDLRYVISVTFLKYICWLTIKYHVLWKLCLLATICFYNVVLTFNLVTYYWLLL